MLPTVLTSALGLVGKGLNAFFGFKQAQGEAVTTAINALGQVSDSDSSYANASSNAIQAVYSGGPLIERLWRPALMWVILVMVVGRWFGWDALSDLPASEISRIYDWLEIGLIGYIPLRSFEKIMRGFQVGSILKTFVGKKMV
jgi:hypothetical protein